MSVEIPGNGKKTTEWYVRGGKVSEEGDDSNSSGPPFATPGDSGSLVFNVNGDIIGLIFGCGNNRAYFTPIKMVLEDIRTQTGLILEFL